MTPEASELPDFDLAPLTASPPDIFTTANDENPDSFVVSLALAYNDLKTVMWLHIQLLNAKPKEPTVSPYAGQRQGMEVFVTRQVLGITHELLDCVREAVRKRMTEIALFKAAVARMPDAARRDWQTICDVAQPGGTHDQFRKYLR